MPELEKNCVLIVDDSLENLELISGLLNDLYTVMAAPSGETALKAVEAKKSPDLILLDVMMPGIDGYEVCRQLKENPKTQDIPIIFLTSKTEIDDETKGFECGAVDFITKPINPSVLKARVQVHLELKKTKDALLKLPERLSRYLSPQIVKILFEEKGCPEIKTQRKKLTIFFSDLCNFTLNCDTMEPEDFTYFINTYLERMSRIALEFGGTVDKFIGDCIMVFFGDPESKGVKEDAIMCLKMAVKMQEAIEELRNQFCDQGIDKHLSARMGIHTGYVNVGNFGYVDRMDYTLLGRNVNLAARLESSSLPGRIHISHETYLLVKDTFECSALEEKLSFKGFERAMQTYMIEEELPSENSSETSALCSATTE